MRSAAVAVLVAGLALVPLRVRGPGTALALSVPGVGPAFLCFDLSGNHPVPDFQALYTYALRGGRLRDLYLKAGIPVQVGDHLIGIDVGKREFYAGNGDTGPVMVVPYREKRSLDVPIWPASAYWDHRADRRKREVMPVYRAELARPWFKRLGELFAGLLRRPSAPSRLSSRG